MLCRRDKCRWYTQPHPRTGRKCYYGEPGCILGMIDLLLAAVKMRITVRRLAALTIIVLAASALAHADSRIGDFIAALNMERASRGLSPLRHSGYLARLAGERADYIAKVKDCNHPGWWGFKREKLPDVDATECVYCGPPVKNGSGLVYGFFTSQPHRRALLGSYRDIGVAVRSVEWGRVREIWVIILAGGRGRYGIRPAAVDVQVSVEWRDGTAVISGVPNNHVTIWADDKVAYRGFDWRQGPYATFTVNASRSVRVCWRGLSLDGGMRRIPEGCRSFIRPFEVPRRVIEVLRLAERVLVLLASGLRR